MKRLQTFLVIFNLIVLSLIINGCATWPKSAQAPEGEEGLGMGVPVAKDLRFDDLPIPKGFRIRRESSFAFNNEVLRVALLRYVGRRRAREVLQFYKDQMSLYNWQMVTTVDYGKMILTYEKGREVCIITIEPATTRTALTIAISPRSSRSSATE